MAATGTGHARGSGFTSIVMTVCFVALVLWFLLGSPFGTVPETDVEIVTAADIEVKPVRQVLSDEPYTKIASMDMHCMNCHMLFDSRPETPRRLTQHTHIVLDHGLNDRCFNCHDNEQRDRLVLRGGKTIPYTEVALLCAKCHGPTYRDWQMGMHGKSMHGWDPEDPNRTRLRCSECHDPHAPAFKAYHPLPGPNTLRMGDPGHDELHTERDEDDPLRRWRDADDHHAPEASE